MRSADVRLVAMRVRPPVTIFAALVAGCWLPDDEVGRVAPPDGGGEPIQPCAGRCACDERVSECARVCVDREDVWCQFACQRGQECRFGCPQGDCWMWCDPLSSCALGCSAGDCNATCQGTKECSTSCESGGCDLDCVGSETCTLECPGGYCTLQCDPLDGRGRCEITECREGCVIRCGDRRDEDCRISCGPEGGCARLH